MPRKGVSNNPSGRPIGVPNKATTNMRELINRFLSDNWQRVMEDFDKLTPKERLGVYERLLQYGLPKMQSVDFVASGGLKQELSQMSEEQLDLIIERIQNNNSKE